MEFYLPPRPTRLKRIERFYVRSSINYLHGFYKKQQFEALSSSIIQSRTHQFQNTTRSQMGSVAATSVKQRAHLHHIKSNYISPGCD
jgi:hypothetical protein